MAHPVFRELLTNTSVQRSAHSVVHPASESHRQLWSTYFGIICWNPCLYSCSRAGTISCLLFHLEASSFSRGGGAGSLHSGRNTIKDKGSRVSSKSFSMWTIVASMSSSQNGGLASNEPQWGRNSRMDLKAKEFRFHQTDLYTKLKKIG